MNKSFKLHLFVRMLFATMIILLANRQISQNFLNNQTEERMRNEMALDLRNCQQPTTQRAEFIHCAETNQSGSIYNTIKHHYHLCTNQNTPLSDKLCDQIKQLDISWQNKVDDAANQTDRKSVV